MHFGIGVSGAYCVKLCGGLHYRLAFGTSGLPKAQAEIIDHKYYCQSGILGFFKYFNFFIDSLTEAMTFFSININTNTLNIILPVGISFYTFQTLSYTIDIYRGKLKATKDIFSFFAFIAFFPQLVAGPIERASRLLPQFQETKKFSNEQSVGGLRLVLWGLFQKIVIADNFAVIVDQIFDGSATISGSATLLGALLFTFQIYTDFAGYSNIAIGISRMIGMDLVRNFNTPYFASSLREFWQRCIFPCRPGFGIMFIFRWAEIGLVCFAPISICC